MNDSSADAPRNRSPMMISAVVGVGVLLLLISTCRPPDQPQSNVVTENSSSENELQDQCERSLKGALDGLRPNRLGLSSESRVIVDTLNNWVNQCAPPEASTADKEDARLLTPLALEQTEQDRFQERDAEHIRNCLLAKAIVDNITSDQRTDRDRAVELFYYVVRTIELVPDSAAGFPQTPYESLLFGRGTAADRAWTFAILLRQLRLDCVIVQPEARQDSASASLLGVIIPGEGVDLFDTRLGLPIASADDGLTALPRRPATLSGVIEDDAPLRQLDHQGTRYPLTAEDLKTIDILAIGTSSTWSPRMERLQMELGEAVELHDGLAANQLRETGLFERLVNAGSSGLWSEEQVGVWTYPESRWSDRSPLTRQQQQILAGYLRVMEGPYDINVQTTEAGPRYVVEDSPRTLHHARIDHLVGDYAAAQPFYIRCRIKFQDFQKIQLPEVQANYLGAELATYWAAQSQYEQKSFQAALDSVRLYLKQHPGGQLRLAASYLGSLCLAQLDQRAEAIELLSTETPQARQALGYQALIDRWNREPDANRKTDGSSPPLEQ